MLIDPVTSPATERARARLAGRGAAPAGPARRRPRPRRSRQASQWCAEAIAADGLVHLFGTGHSRIPVEEMFPRYGSYPGFNPIVELSMTFHTQVVGANGQRQAMFIERVPGLAEVILSNFAFGPSDVMMVFSASGLSAVPVEMARGARRRGLRVIAVTSVAAVACRRSPSPLVGSRLLDEADLVIDLCTPHADALVTIDGLDTPVGPGSTIAAVAIVNSIKVRTAELLVERGAMPPVITRASVVGADRSRQLFDDAYREHARASLAYHRYRRSEARAVTRRRCDRAVAFARLPATGPIRSSTRPDRHVVARGGERMIQRSNRSDCSSAWRPSRIASACSGSGRSAPVRLRRRRSSAAAPRGAERAAAKPYKIGYSNTGGTGNGFREEQNCTAKAEALASGEVSRAHDDHPRHGRRGPAPGPPRPDRQGRPGDRLQPELTRMPSTRRSPRRRPPASRRSSVDAYVTDPDTYNLYNNQVKYAELGAKWLFDQLGGKGTVYYMRGIAGHPADSDRDIGLQERPQGLPEHQGRAERRWRRHRLGSGDRHQAGQRVHRQRRVRQDPGHLDVRHRLEVVDAIKAAGKKFVPIVGTDRGSFVDAAPRPDRVSRPRRARP